MVIVSSSAFLGFHGSGSTTLLGKLVTYWRTQHPVHKWIDWRSVADASVNLPGVLAPRPPSLQPHTIRPAYAPAFSLLSACLGLGVLLSASIHQSILIFQVNGLSRHWPRKCLYSEVVGPLQSSVSSILLSIPARSSIDVHSVPQWVRSCLSIAGKWTGLLTMPRRRTSRPRMCLMARGTTHCAQVVTYPTFANRPTSHQKLTGLKRTNKPKPELPVVKEIGHIQNLLRTLTNVTVPTQVHLASFVV